MIVLKSSENAVFFLIKKHVSKKMKNIGTKGSDNRYINFLDKGYGETVELMVSKFTQK